MKYGYCLFLVWSDGFLLRFLESFLVYFLPVLKRVLSLFYLAFSFFDQPFLPNYERLVLLSEFVPANRFVDFPLRELKCGHVLVKFARF